MSNTRRIVVPLKVRPMLISGTLADDGRGPVILIDSEQPELEQVRALWHETLHLLGLQDEGRADEIAEILAAAEPGVLRELAHNINVPSSDVLARPAPMPSAELSISEAPLAWLVFCDDKHPEGFDYMVYPDEHDAKVYACEIDKDDDAAIPLYRASAFTVTPSATASSSELERLRERVAEVEEAEARRCPEDVGFEEYIGVLERRIGERDVTIANQVAAINAMNVATSAREAMSAVAALDTVIASMKEASERRYQVAQEAEREAHKWKAEGDMYGWNYHAGRAGGGHECDIIYFRALRAAEDLRKKLRATTS